MKRRIKKIGQAFLLAILALVALIYAPVWDTAPPDVADLAVVRNDVPPEENAYTCFLQATNALRRVDHGLLSQYRQGLTNDDVAVAAALATNQSVIAWIRLGVERPHCQLPVVDTFNLFANPISDFLEIGHLLATQARFERNQGRMSEATDTALLLMRYGNRLQQASGILVEYLVGSAIVSMGVGQARDLARDGRCGAAERARLTAGLAELEPGAGLENVVKGEYLCMADMLQQCRDGAAYQSYWAWGFDPAIKRFLLTLFGRVLYFPSYFMQYNRTHHWHADTLRLLRGHAATPYGDHPLRDRSDDRRPPSHDTRWPFANALGRHIWRIVSSTLDSVIHLTCCTESDLSATRLLLACRAYEETTGHLPETLEALVPDYLPAVPRDPFDGAPFRYSAERRLVYSVGENLKDDGGTDGRERGRRRAKDLVYTLDAQEQPQRLNSCIT